MTPPNQVGIQHRIVIASKECLCLGVNNAALWCCILSWEKSTVEFKQKIVHILIAGLELCDKLPTVCVEIRGIVDTRYLANWLKYVVRRDSPPGLAKN